MPANTRRRFNPPPHPDPVITRAMRDIGDALDELDRTIPVRLERPDILLTTTDTAVRHGLAAPVRGWEVVRLRPTVAGTYPVVVEGAEHSEPATFMNFRASAACTVTLRFFS